MTNGSNAGKNGSRRLLFIHIPKTAGTSFRSELERHFGSRRVFPGSWFLQRRYRYQYPSLEQFLADFQDIRSEVKVITGHYPYSQLLPILTEIDRAVFIREPIARAISYLRHEQARNPHFRRASLESIAGLDRDQPNLQIVNLQTRFLSTHRSPEDRLDSALTNLREFEFVGLSERYAESVRVCNRIFRLDLMGSRHDNRGSNNNYAVSLELIDYLREHNREDLVLYQDAVKYFEEISGSVPELN